MRIADRLKSLVRSHWERRTLHDFVLDPDHIERAESATFRKAKDELCKDGHYQCWVCGAQA